MEMSIFHAADRPHSILVILVSIVVGMTCLLSPGSAKACATVITDHSYRAEYRDARADIETSDAIIDGEVIRPYIEGKQTALVRAEHVLKGPKQDVFEIIVTDSCSYELTNMGERSRMYLVEHQPGLYDVIDRGWDRMKDRILKSDSRKVWPLYPGVKPATP